MVVFLVFICLFFSSIKQIQFCTCILIVHRSISKEKKAKLTNLNEYFGQPCRCYNVFQCIQYIKNVSKLFEANIQFGLTQLGSLRCVTFPLCLKLDDRQLPLPNHWWHFVFIQFVLKFIVNKLRLTFDILNNFFFLFSFQNYLSNKTTLSITMLMMSFGIFQT